MLCVGYIIQAQTLSDTENNILLNPIWEYASGGKTIGVPVVSDKVYIYAEDRQIHALSFKGDEQWTFFLSGRPADTLCAGQDGSLYASTKEGLFYAINKRGKKIWSINFDSEPSGAPSIAPDGTIYIGLKNRKLCALSHKGILRWKADCPSELLGSPFIDGGTAVYFYAVDGKIYSCSPWGDILWTVDTACLDGRFMNAAIKDHVLYAAAGKNLMAITSDKKELWSVSFSSNCSGISIFEKGLFLVFESGKTAAYNFSGELLWENDKQFYSSYPISGEKYLYMNAENGLSCIDFNGNEVGFGQVEGLSLTQPVMGNEIIVCGSEEWIVSAFYITDSEASLWSQKGGGASHSGKASKKRWYFDEEQYKDDINYLFLKQQINEGTIEDKKAAVDEIALKLEGGKGASRREDYLLQLLYEVLSQGSLSFTVRGRTSYNDTPKVKIKASDLIGRYGNFESVEILSAILAEEEDYTVSIAIIKALGQLGTNYKGMPMHAIYNKVVNDNSSTAYNNLALAVIEACQNIREYCGDGSGGLYSATLFTIYRGHYSAAVRKKAVEALRRQI